VRLWASDPEHDRLRLRALRASPPGLAQARGVRRQVFAASLGQFDELLTAAAAVGPASAPLPLYYALNQAGRAIAAAQQQDPSRWQPQRHGLRVGDPPPTLGATVVSPWKPGKGRPSDDSFSVMADTIGSPRLTDATTLGALWAAAPGAERVKRLGASETPALALEPVDAGRPSIQARLPGAITSGQAALRKRLERGYPLARVGMDLSVGLLTGERVAHVSWRTPTGVIRALSDVTSRFPGPEGAFYLMPGLGTNDDVLTPLMVWWALLYALSHVARYQPAAWTRALDPLNSTLAVPIESALTWAREVMPGVILEVLAR
jgi:YaaC-like Protein